MTSKNMTSTLVNKTRKLFFLKIYYASEAINFIVKGIYYFLCLNISKFK